MSEMIEVAKEAAIEAGKLSLRSRNKIHKIEFKGDSDNLLTEVDIACNRIITKAIVTNFPTASIISEESKEKQTKSNLTWVIDPIDGTASYVAGLPTYGISIGLLKSYQPYLGVIFFPVTGNLFWAEKGKGAFLNRKKIHVHQNDSVENAIVGFDFENKGGRKKEIERTTFKFIDEVRYAPVLGSVIAGLTNVAQGIYDAYLQWAYIWDFAAGIPIIEEAGGKVTDYHGYSVDWSKKELQIIASNGLIHDQLVDLIKL